MISIKAFKNKDAFPQPIMKIIYINNRFIVATHKK